MNTRKQFSRIGWAYVLFLITTIVVQVMAAMISRSTIYLYDLSAQMLLSQVIMYGCGFPVFFLLMRRIPAWQMTRPKEITPGKFILFVIFCFGFSYIGNIIGQILMFIVNGVTGAGAANPVDDMVADLNLGIMVITTVIIAPVMEELMFRKLLIDRIVPFGQKTAILVSGISFGLFHGNFYQFFYACILGMVFAYIYSSTGKIKYTIFLHMIINCVGGMVPALLLRTESEIFMLFSGLGLVIWMGVCIVAAIVLSCLYFRKLSFFPAWEGDTGQILKNVITAPGVIAFIILCIIMFLMN